MEVAVFSSHSRCSPQGWEAFLTCGYVIPWEVRPVYLNDSGRTKTQEHTGNLALASHTWALPLVPVKAKEELGCDVRDVACWCTDHQLMDLAHRTAIERHWARAGIRYNCRAAVENAHIPRVRVSRFQPFLYPPLQHPANMYSGRHQYWLKSVGPCHPLERPPWSSRLRSWPSLLRAVAGICGVN